MVSYSFSSIFYKSFSDAPLDAIMKTKVICDTLNLAMIPLIQDKNVLNEVAGDEENLLEINDNNDAVSSASASSLPVSRSSSPSVSATKKIPFRKLNSMEKRASQNPLTRVRTYANRIRCERLRKGNFIRIFPRKENFYLYKDYIEEIDFRHEKQDMLLYKTLYEEDPESVDVSEDIEKVHQELLDAKAVPTSADLSESAMMFLKDALSEAAQYEAEKHPNGYRIYPSK